MNHCRATGWNLLVVQWGKNVLRIAAVDPVAVAVEHEHVDEMGALIHRPCIAGVTGQAITGKDLSTRTCCELHPDFIGIDRTLAERMANGQCAHHHLHQVIATRLERGQVGPQWPQQLAIDGAAVLQGEKINPQFLVAQMLGMCFDILLECGCLIGIARFAFENFGQPCIGSNKQMVVHLAYAATIEIAGAKVVGRGQWHMAGGAVFLGFFRVVEAARSMA